jgi:ATP-dependent RNA circularization protein (DNA/RNA ligase family)
LEQALRSAGNYAVQAESAGPGIQDNHYGLKDLDLFCFNVFDINRGRHLDFADYQAFCQQYGIPMAPVANSDFVLDHTVAQLLDMVETQRYPNGHQAEGWVIRPLVEQYSRVLGSRASFKVLSNEYDLKKKKKR